MYSLCQHLIVNNLNEHLHTSLHYVIRAVNNIIGNSLIVRSFSRLCLENDEDFNRLLIHTGCHWISKGNLPVSILRLIWSNAKVYRKQRRLIAGQLDYIKNAISYCTDIYKKFIEINLQLHGDEFNENKKRCCSFCWEISSLQAEFSFRAAELIATVLLFYIISL